MQVRHGDTLKLSAVNPLARLQVTDFWADSKTFFGKGFASLIRHQNLKAH
jgi:hypothetical protein